MDDMEEWYVVNVLYLMVSPEFIFCRLILIKGDGMKELRFYIGHRWITTILASVIKV